MNSERLEDAEASAAFDGPSTEAERLRVRCAGCIGVLNEMINHERTADATLRRAHKLVTLLERLQRAK